MGDRRKIMQRAKIRIRFNDEDMDFALTWVLGISDLFGWSHGEVFAAVANIKDGDGDSWRAAFIEEGEALRERAMRSASDPVQAGQSHFGACYAFRAAIQYADPTKPEYLDLYQRMEQAFAEAVNALRVPLRPISIPFEGKSLPGYFLEIGEAARPTLVAIGGGDTSREDLFYFAGYPGWKPDYNVLMVDLPGQGRTPADGLHMRQNAEVPIRSVTDWLFANTKSPLDQLAIFGLSAGGFFSARAVNDDKRYTAWIASTPIFNLGEMFRREFKGARVPGPLLRLLLRVIGLFKSGLSLNLNKYAWQAGTNDFATAVRNIIDEAPTADSKKIHCPALFLVGASEAGELKRQSHELFRILRSWNHPVELREFSVADGADAHCQVNNLRLAHQVTFDWLDRTFGRPPAHERIDARQLC